MSIFPFSLPRMRSLRPLTASRNPVQDPEVPSSGGMLYPWKPLLPFSLFHSLNERNYFRPFIIVRPFLSNFRPGHPSDRFLLKFGNGKFQFSFHSGMDTDKLLFYRFLMADHRSGWYSMLPARFGHPSSSLL